MVVLGGRGGSYERGTPVTRARSCTCFWCSGFGDSGLGLRGQGSGLRVHDEGFRRIEGSGGVQDEGSRVRGPSWVRGERESKRERESAREREREREASERQQVTIPSRVLGLALEGVGFKVWGLEPQGGLEVGIQGSGVERETTGYEPLDIDALRYWSLAQLAS